MGLGEKSCPGEPGLHLLQDETRPPEQAGLCGERGPGCNQHRGSGGAARARRAAGALPAAKLAEHGL